MLSTKEKHYTLVFQTSEKDFKQHGRGLASHYSYTSRKNDKYNYSIRIGYDTPENQNLLRRVIHQIEIMILLHHNNLSQHDMKKELIRLALIPKDTYPDILVTPETTISVTMLHEWLENNKQHAYLEYLDGS